MQAFEPRLTAELFARWPDRVAEVLAHDEERAWLLLADAGTPLRESGNPPETWLVALPMYAELQRGEAAHAVEHLAHRVPDLRVETLPARYEELVHHELPLERDEIRQLQAFAPRFAQLYGKLAEHDVPHSIQHDDLPPGEPLRARRAAACARLGRRVDLAPVHVARRDVPVPRRDQQAVVFRSVVRALARCVPGAVGSRSCRRVRARNPCRNVCARVRVGAATRPPAGGGTSRLNRWADSYDVAGLFQVDSFAEALPFAAAGLALLVAVAHLLGPVTKLSQRLATGLLEGDGVHVVRSPAETREHGSCVL